MRSMAWSDVVERCLHCGTTENEYAHKGLCIVCYKAWLVERFEVPKIPKRWSKKHDCCASCGTVEVRHVSQGLCRTCYGRWANERYRPEGVRHESRGLSEELSRSKLRELYVEDGQSTTDIARAYGCTRQYVSLLLQRCGIRRKSYFSAHVLAIEAGKLSHPTGDGLGRKRLLRRHVNSKFFSCWSQPMAWVLGVIATDGNILMARKRDASHNAYSARLSISQKESELLEKVANLMKSDTPLAFRPKRGIKGATYLFETSDSRILRDLIGLGIEPRKSRTLQFPAIPAEFVRDFIRGCWDGDGTVYIGARGNGVAGFGSGSRAFVDSMIRWLAGMGFPPTTIHEDSRSPGYCYFRLHGGLCEKLFHVLYDDTDDSMRLSRKYEVFKAIVAQNEQSPTASSLP